MDLFRIPRIEVLTAQTGRYSRCEAPFLGIVSQVDEPRFGTTPQSNDTRFLEYHPFDHIISELLLRLLDPPNLSLHLI